MTIKRQLIKVLIICALISVAINTIVLSVLINKYFVEYTKTNYEENIEAIEEYAEKVLEEDNYTNAQIEVQLEAYLDDPILGVKLYNAQGELLAEVFNESTQRHGIMSRMMGKIYEETNTVEITESGELIGTINITQITSMENSSATRMFKGALIGYSLASFGIVLVIAILIAIFMSKKMSKDLQNTASQALSIDLGDKINIKLSKVKEIRIIQQSLETLQSRLKLKQTSRKKLLDEMVHQTRTPLTILKTHLEGFEDGVIEMTLTEIETCGAQIDAITAIISNMSGMIDAEKDIDTIKVEEFELSHLLKQIIGGLNVQFTKKQIGLELLNNEKIDLKTDKYKLSQCIYNILTNAYKFTESKGKVTISYKVEEGKVIIEIQDTGVGIDKENLDHIFEAYYRGDNVEDIPGEGIGLYVVKQNLDKIGGNIKVESEKGLGSKFIIDLSV